MMGVLAKQTATGTLSFSRPCIFQLQMALLKATPK
jgi:hypothetical protein